ncbi:bifunctional DNA-formamidopyrimidine glycosylase/DNA-(apurinic or apyrimidinic site) lyase [Patescibacteria group bacterium]|nr:bifunctional DNA-formamidopyrimidine glycosylase/DNA-(apurinic or apyrimidinic site) lyase [Patescibacteria group bacterium]
MPELPEVETIRRQLHERLAGQIIDSIIIIDSDKESPKGEGFAVALGDKLIKSVDRRAKLLIIRFSDNSGVTIHLKMTGRLVFVAKESIPTKHDRWRLSFTNSNDVLQWSDVRRFGYTRYLESEAIELLLGEYGPEPLDASVNTLALALQKQGRSRSVKAALLDQSVIAGVGNIYADEACFRAGILPMTRVHDLSITDLERIAIHVQAVLKESIAQKGTSANDYVDAKGERGGFLGLLRVYGREHEPCVNCKTPIKRTVHASRGTHYCASCQK